MRALRSALQKQLAWGKIRVSAGSIRASNHPHLFSTLAVVPGQHHHQHASLRGSSVPFSLATTASNTTTTTTRSFSTPSLYNILTREHAEEIENDSTGMPNELSELKQKLQKDWKIVDSDAVTKLYRTSGALKVQLSFHCQDTVDVMDDDYQEDAVADMAEIAGPVRFTVTVTKAGKTLVLTCLSEDAQARIQSVSMTTEDIDTVHTKGGVGSSMYGGPVFVELAEDLQDAFHEFLQEDVGLTEDVASFVSMYADYREQLEYVKFLEEAKSITQ